MTRVRTALALALAATVGVASTPQNRQRPTFRAGTDVVTLTAFVRQGNLTVPGLTGSDFIVTDNGVRQTVTAIPGEAVPFDLTIVLDLSGSIEGMLDQLKRQVREVAALLRPDDRLRLVTFSDKIVDIFGFLPGDADLPLDDLRAGPLTPLYDSMAMTLMRVRPADRGQVVVLLTDGYDTSSTYSLNQVREVALRSEDVFHLFIVHQDPGALPVPHEQVDTRRFWWPEALDIVAGGPPTQIMGDIARITGGEMSEIFSRDHIPGDLKQAIEDFRASYILQYTVQGVDPKGRHKLSVKLDRPGDYSIRARREYEGG
jgi:VWFA-related protein